MKPIVVATDLTRISEPALCKALTLARELGADVVLVHAWEPVAVAVLDAAVLASPERIAHRTRELQRHLDDLVERYRPEHEKLTARLVDGKPSAEIIRVASEIGAQMIAVGTHHTRSGLRRLLGSVADEIIHTAPCPVLVVRADA